MLPTCKYNDLFLIPHLPHFPSKSATGTPKKQGTCCTFAMFSRQVALFVNNFFYVLQPVSLLFLCPL